MRPDESLGAGAQSMAYAVAETNGRPVITSRLVSPAEPW